MGRASRSTREGDLSHDRPATVVLDVRHVWKRHGTRENGNLVWQQNNEGLLINFLMISRGV